MRMDKLRWAAYRKRTAHFLAALSLLMGMHAAHAEVDISVQALIPGEKVTVRVLVTDPESGEPITDLQATDFRFFENGSGLIVPASLAKEPISVVFVMDYSLSLESAFDENENAVINFIQGMATADEFAIVKFAETVNPTVTLTPVGSLTDSEIGEAVRRDDPSKRVGSRIYDAVDEGIRLLDAADVSAGRGAVILLTDGCETTETGLSQIPAYPVYPVGLRGDNKADTCGGASTNHEVMEYIAEISGATYERGGELASLPELQERLESQYVLRYASATPWGDCRDINLKVDVDVDADASPDQSGEMIFDRCVPNAPVPPSSESSSGGASAVSPLILLVWGVGLAVCRRRPRIFRHSSCHHPL